MLPVRPITMGMDVDAIRKSSLWALFGPAIRSEINEDQDFKDLQSDCGIDLVGSLSYLWLAIDPDDAAADGTPNGGMIAKGPLATKIWQCLQKANPAIGDFITSDGVTMTSAGRDMLVASLGGGVAGVRKSLAGNGLTNSPSFQRLAAKVDLGASLWMLVTEIPKSAQVEVKDAPIKIELRQMYMSIDVTHGLEGKLGIVFANERQAQDSGQVSRLGLANVAAQPNISAGAKSLAKKVNIAVSGRTLEFSMVLDERELLSAIGTIATLLQGEQTPVAK